MSILNYYQYYFLIDAYGKIRDMKLDMLRRQMKKKIQLGQEIFKSKGSDIFCYICKGRTQNIFYLNPT